MARRAYFALLASISTVPSFAQTQTWTIAPDRSDVRIHVGKGGLLSVAGHTHEVIAPAISGSVRFNPDRIEQADIEITFAASALRVTGEGEPAKDVPEVQRTMLSEKVLDVEKYPTITFRSRQVTAGRRTGDVAQLRVAGDLTLHGRTRQIDVPVDVKFTPDTLTGSGKMTVKQTEFGIQPITAGLGAVKVKDEVAVTFMFTAHR